MKKKLLIFCSIFFTLIVLFQNLLSIFASIENSIDEFKGVWISFLDLKPIIYQKTEDEFKTNINKVFDNIKGAYLTDVIVQVRPFSDALYDSKIFPCSDMFTGTQGEKCEYDPLKIMVSLAHQKGLKIHAWVNPYRIKNPGSDLKLSGNHPAIKWLKERNTDEVIELKNGGIYYNPSSENTIKLVVDGVNEIVKNYDVDGIHLDDYFYPTKEENIDKNLYEKFRYSGKYLTLNEYRIEKVNSLISQIYKNIKDIKPNISFGISPSGDIDSNYEVHYSDVKKWLAEPGYIDYLCPQIYFGLKNEKHPFNETLNQWSNLKRSDNVRLYIGLANYKIGTEDKWAGSSDVSKKEWLDDNHDVISRQIRICRDNKGCSGFVFFRYDSLFNPLPYVKDAVNKEMSYIIPLLKR